MAHKGVAHTNWGIVIFLFGKCTPVFWITAVINCLCWLWSKRITQFDLFFFTFCVILFSSLTAADQINAFLYTLYHFLENKIRVRSAMWQFGSMSLLFCYFLVNVTQTLALLRIWLVFYLYFKAFCFGLLSEELHLKPHNTHTAAHWFRDELLTSIIYSSNSVQKQPVNPQTTPMNKP